MECTGSLCKPDHLGLVQILGRRSYQLATVLLKVWVSLGTSTIEKGGAEAQQQYT